MKYCPRCGAASEDDAMFCGNCGNRFETEDRAETAESYRQDYGTKAASGEQVKTAYKDHSNAYNRGQNHRTDYPNQNYDKDSRQDQNYTQYRPQKNGNGNDGKNKAVLAILAALIGVMVVLIGITVYLLFGTEKDSDTKTASSSTFSEAASDDSSVSVSSVSVSSVSVSGESSPVSSSSRAASSDSAGSTAAIASSSSSEKASGPSAMYLLTSEPDLSSYAAASVKGATASSVIVQEEQTSNQPTLLFDNDENTNWQEGVDGPGIGESVTCTLSQPSKVKYLGFKLGSWKKDDRYDYYKDNNRPKTLMITVGTFQSTVTFSDNKVVQWVELDVPVETSTLTFEIRDVYNGSEVYDYDDQKTERWDDTVISDIFIYGEK